jgi:hypothetical protein
MQYFSVKENDGTHSIRKSSESGCTSEIVLVGVRGCNVLRTIDKLYRLDAQAKQQPYTCSLCGHKGGFRCPKCHPINPVPGLISLHADWSLDR